jgi:hypothetical protein
VQLSRLILLVLALWPPVHHVMVKSYDLNPWKLLGFSMYCLPHVASTFYIDETRVPARPISDVSPTLRAAMEDYSSTRNCLGRLAHPRGIARKILQEKPAIEALLIQIQVTRLDASSHVSEAGRSYRFSRSLRAVGTASSPRLR